MTDADRIGRIAGMVAEFRTMASRGEFDAAPWWDRFRTMLAELYPGVAKDLDGTGLPDRNGVGQIVHAMGGPLSTHVGIFVADMDKYRRCRLPAAGERVDHLAAWRAAARFFDGLALSFPSMAKHAPPA